MIIPSFLFPLLFGIMVRDLPPSLLPDPRFQLIHWNFHANRFMLALITQIMHNRAFWSFISGLRVIFSGEILLQNFSYNFIGRLLLLPFFNLSPFFHFSSMLLLISSIEPGEKFIFTNCSALLFQHFCFLFYHPCHWVEGLSISPNQMKFFYERMMSALEILALFF